MTATPTAGPHLEIRDRDDDLVVFPLRRDRVTFGRGREAMVLLDSPTVSRRHAELVPDPFGRWWIRDLGSRNGVKYSGARIKEAPLYSGDQFGIGAYTVTLCDTTTGTTPPLTPVDSPASVASVTDVSTVPDGTISRIEDDGEARINHHHLLVLTQLGHDLSRARNERERIYTLCSLMVRPEFHGQSAAVLRYPRTGRKRQQYPLLGEPQGRKGPLDKLPYLSQRLLQYVAAADAPAMARNDGTADPAVMEMTLSPDQVALAAIACPLRSDGEAVDMLYGNFAPKFGTPQWMALVTLAARQFQQAEAALQVRQQAQEHAVLEKDLERAGQIQRNLLPQALDITGLDIAIGFEPCRWIGGDYPDVIRLPDGRVLALIADVSGKGLPAALIASSLHSIVHTAIRAGQSLADMLQSLDHHLRLHLADSSFVTLVALAIDPATGEFECLNAGHLPPLRIKRNGGIAEMQSTRHAALGIMDQTFQCQRGRLAHDELIVLFTDGLTELHEAESDQLFIGLKGLKQHLTDLCRTRSAKRLEHLAALLNARLDGLRGDDMPTDDRTFVMLRRT